ncbi:hypothetical protein GCM10009616_03830 [Microlunatus lacustris]
MLAPGPAVPALVAAVDAQVSDGEAVDPGWDRPVTMRWVAALSAAPPGRSVRVSHLRWSSRTRCCVWSDLSAPGRAHPRQVRLPPDQAGSPPTPPGRCRCWVPVPTAADPVRRWLTA